MSPQGRSDMQIGATLRDARRRMGLEIREVEARTKIRARYLRALENEDWETLPAPAYIRGFLRTYGRMLGLDGEMLADEFRRRYSEPDAPSGPPPSEPLLTERRRRLDRAPSRGPLILGIVAAIVVLLVVLGSLGGDDSDEEPRNRGQEQARQGGNQGAGGNKQGGGGRKKNKPAPLEEETASVRAVTGIEVCLVSGSDTALIDGQVLGAGTQERYEKAGKRYRLDLRNAGTVRFRVGGESRRLEVDEPASFEGDSRGIREIEYRGPDCP